MSKCDHCGMDCLNWTTAGDIEEIVSKKAARFNFSPMFQSANPTEVTWRKLPDSEKFVQEIDVHGRKVLSVSPAALTALTHEAMVDIQHFFRRDHLEGWRRILDDPEASPNDKFVATQLLRNACIAAGRQLPACQDTGTAIVMGKRGELVWTGGADEEHISKGVWMAYTQHNFRYSQVAALTMFDEVNTKNNLPAQIDLLATPGSEYKFLFIAKGGGSANKAYLYQQTKALLTPSGLKAFVEDKLKSLGTSACPPYHIALVIGGTSAEMTMKTVKLASCRYYDDLPTSGDASGRAFRDVEWEQIILEMTRNCGVGAQFGGKYFAHQVRVIRLARHGASCPVGLGVSCSADRQALGKITAEGVFVEELEHDPARYLPDALPTELASGGAVSIDLSRPMSEIRAELSKYPVKTRLSLNGTIVVARDMAHTKLQERLDAGLGLPEYAREKIIYYAGPAKTPKGYASGSFGPTTAGRMDSYVGPFMAAGGSFVTLAKGNRSKQVTDACKKYGGFYLGSIGGPAAVLAQDNITKVQVLEYEELGMEAVWQIEVKDFPAFIVVDDKGNDFYGDLL